MTSCAAAAFTRLRRSEAAKGRVDNLISLNMADICAVCHKEVRGGFEVYTKEKANGFHIVVDSTPDRDFNACDSCNKTVHFRCCGYPESGYCDACIDEYKLYDLVQSRRE